MPQRKQSEPCILMFASAKTEGRIATELLEAHDYRVTLCGSVSELTERLRDGADLVIVHKMALDEHALQNLLLEMSRQPSWSRANLIVILPAGEVVRPDAGALSMLEAKANLVFIESPLKEGLFIRTVKAALADRKRQYALRDLLAELETSRHEAVEASRAKSDFLANMSHEIRTPLGAILGFTELMMDSGISRREKKDYMMAARRNGEMLSALIDDILDLSRVEAGRMEITKLEFSLSELLSEVVSALEPLASKKGLPLLVKRPSEGNQIVADPIRVKQILVNIVGNAIKFTSHGSVDVRLDFSEGPGSKSSLNIEVEDTGIGISLDQASRLFKPFTQADTSTTRKFGGTGLGLVLSQKLARAMGGDLKLKWSIPGGGSCFAVSLPVGVVSQIKAKPLEIAAPSSKLPLQGSKILLVDDSLDNQMLISRILRLLGAEVDLASDGLEGIEKARAGEFDVVLMDLQMPRLGGVEATRLLREQGYTAPIVALTAHALQEDRQRCISVGCTDYLTKPVQRSHLVQVIERLAQSRSSGSTAEARH